jgi:beta-lactamase superfamily II metal-dependent hydrolase
MPSPRTWSPSSLLLSSLLALPLSGGCAHTSSPASPAASAQAPIDVYWVDVEGGAATFIVTPGKQVLLADTGFPGARDGERVLRVLREQIHASAIDYLIVTHYHLDHVGNVPYLAARVPIKTFVDHGASVEPGNDAEYLKLAQRRLTVKAGDTLPLEGASLTFVTANGDPIATALEGGGPNEACASATPGDKKMSDENSRSLGFVLRRGKFAFADLGDLLWANEHDLACPTNKLGQVDLFQVTHHGMDISNAPQLVHALKPVVAILDNGPTKGGAPKTYEVLKTAPGIEDVWQLHRAVAADNAHNAPDDRIANFEDGAADAAHFIKASIAPDGTITVTNGRTGASKTYQSR